MIRARHAFAATLTGVTLIGATLLAQAPVAPPMTPILAGKKFIAPAKGQVEIDITQPVSKREKENVVTRIQVKNTSAAPIARLAVDETWYDKGGALVVGNKGIINGLLQPGEIQTVVISTPYNAKMAQNNWNFSHANGTVKPRRVAKITTGDEKEAPAKPAAAKPAAKKK